MPSNNDYQSNAKAFEELRRMQQQREENSVASKHRTVGMSEQRNPSDS